MTSSNLYLISCNALSVEKYDTPVKRLPMKIKRIPGGQTAGMALISANAPAFESYGLEASLIAPTCQECGERFSNAANALIEDERTHITVGPVVYVFWTKAEDDGFSVASLLSTPEPDDSASTYSFRVQWTRSRSRNRYHAFLCNSLLSQWRPRCCEGLAGHDCRGGQAPSGTVFCPATAS